MKVHRDRLDHIGALKVVVRIWWWRNDEGLAAEMRNQTGIEVRVGRRRVVVVI